MFKNKRKCIRVITKILLVCITIASLHFIATNVAILRLYKQIKQFNKIQYNHQIIPYKDDNGYYTLKSNRDINILELNDIHIGGGAYSIKRDAKTVYEVMSIVSIEKPDLVILNGDNVFPVPYPLFNGGGTLNNKMASSVVIRMFDQLGVYFTTSFGNHDTEAFGFTSRDKLYDYYKKQSKYCIADCNYDGYGTTNQCILLKDCNDKITKALMIIDSNDYVDDSLNASINWLYDTIKDSQVNWAKETINELSKQNNSLVKSLVFCHIPIGEFESAYEDLKSNNFKSTSTTQYIEGYYNEQESEYIRGRIYYGGCQNKDLDPSSLDTLFEQLGPDGLNSLEAIYCGHDHVNNAVLKYKGVLLSYGLSIDNVAYKDICKYGLQRGSTYINVSSSGEYYSEHRNAYSYYNLDSNKYYKVDTTSYYYPNPVIPTK